jgi:membrane protein implicated in regulation of membrane protease activity
MTWVWLGIAIFFLIVELATAEIVAVWFFGSAFILTIVAAIFPNLFWAWQIVIFIALSAILLWASRPLVKKMTAKSKNEATNLDLLLGRKALVVQAIDNDMETGAVKLNGLEWSARTESGEKIEKGNFVMVKAIHGNKFIVPKTESRFFISLETPDTCKDYRIDPIVYNR